MGVAMLVVAAALVIGGAALMSPAVGLIVAGCLLAAFTALFVLEV